MAKVSVIIPNYNHAAFLRQRINSVLNQTYRDFEVIILDDCSPDNSRDVIMEYAGHEKVSQVVFNDANSGTTFKQWQKGIKLAKGEYIWIAESDDWCEPTLLETLMSGMLRNPKIGLAFCQSYYYYEPDYLKEITYYPHYEKVESGKDFLQKHMLKGNNIVNASMAVWKKDLYKKVDLEFTYFKFCGDWLFWISIMQQCDVFVSGRVLNYFRNHDKDVSSKAYASGNNIIENLELYKILHRRGIINAQQLKACVEHQYVIFLGIKNSFSQESLEKISNAFNQNKALNLYDKFYYVLKNKAHVVKRFLFDNLSVKTA